MDILIHFFNIAKSCNGASHVSRIFSFLLLLFSNCNGAAKYIQRSILNRTGDNGVIAAHENGTTKE